MLYSRTRLARLLNISPHLFSVLEKEGILKPLKVIRKRRYYGFNEYISLRTVQKLKENGISPRKMVANIKSAKKYFKHLKYPLTQIKFITLGKELFMKRGEEMVNANGQYMLTELFKEEESQVCPISQTSWYWFEMASKYDQDPDNYEKAKSYYKKALYYEPNMFEALHNLGTLYYKMSRIKLSEKYYLKALELDNKNYLLLYNLGNLYDETMDFEKAIKFYYRSIEERNGFADPHYNLALLYMKMEEWEKAIKHFQLYILLDPNSIWSSIARKQIDRIGEIIRKKSRDND